MLWLFIYVFPDVTVSSVMSVQVSAVPCEAGVPGTQLPDHNPQWMQIKDADPTLRVMGRIKSNTEAELLTKKNSESKKLCHPERNL